MAVILLVEDNEMNRDMLSRRLTRKSHTVLLAQDGQQAVDMAIEHKPDIILMDMSLPIKDGWEASKEIKANPSTEDIPIIALTAHAMEGDKQNAIEAGCVDYDTKPIDLPRLLKKIDHWTTT